MLNYTDKAVSLTIRMSLEELVIDYSCARITSFQSSEGITQKFCE